MFEGRNSPILCVTWSGPAASSNETDELAYVRIRSSCLPRARFQTDHATVYEGDVQIILRNCPRGFSFRRGRGRDGSAAAPDTFVSRNSISPNALELAESAVGEDEFGYRREFVKLLSGLAGPLASLPVYHSPVCSGRAHEPIP
jgi:hypothetical protein